MRSGDRRVPHFNDVFPLIQPQIQDRVPVSAFNFKTDLASAFASNLKYYVHCGLVKRFGRRQRNLVEIRKIFGRPEPRSSCVLLKCKVIFAKTILPSQIYRFRLLFQKFLLGREVREVVQPVFNSLETSAPNLLDLEPTC